VMLVGTVLAAFPGRRRRSVAPVSEPLREVAHEAARVPSNGDGHAGTTDEEPVEVRT